MQQRVVLNLRERDYNYNYNNAVNEKKILKNKTYFSCDTVIDLKSNFTNPTLLNRLKGTKWHKISWSNLMEQSGIIQAPSYMQNMAPFYSCTKMFYRAFIAGRFRIMKLRRFIT